MALTHFTFARPNPLGRSLHSLSTRHVHIQRQVWTVSLPVTILNSPAVSDVSQGGSDPSFGTARDIIGIILWGIGWLIETVADAQKVCYLIDPIN